MATELKSLKIDRVDLVPEGANSAAFVTLYKERKELESMEISEIIAKLKPEHAEAIQAELDTLAKSRNEAIAERDAAVAKADQMAEDAKQKASEEDQTDEVGKEASGTLSFDDDEQVAKSLEGLDPALRDYVDRLAKQKEAAETIAKEAIAKERHSEAVAKAEELRALPVEKSALVDFIERSDSGTVDMLTSIAKGIEGTVLTEVGKSYTGESFAGSSADSWGKIESCAVTIAKERNITKEAAISVVIDEQPELYRDYLKGGAN